MMKALGGGNTWRFTQRVLNTVALIGWLIGLTAFVLLWLGAYGA